MNAIEKLMLDNCFIIPDVDTCFPEYIRLFL